MKTIEEKAQAYDEALEFARKLNKESWLSQELKDILKQAFPELVEDENERIRYSIISLIKFGLEDGSAVSPAQNITKEEALAWLENQKTIKTPRWMIDFLDKNRSKFSSIMDGYDEQREAEGKLLAIIDWLEGNPNINGINITL